MKKFITFLFIMIALCLTSSPIHAEVYKWVDEKGTVHFTQDPSNIPEKYRDKVKSRVMEEEPVSPYKKVEPMERSPSRSREPISSDRDRYPGRAGGGQKKTDEEVVSSPSPGYIPFDKFKYIQEGMTEAEVLSRFGSPTREVQDEAKSKGNLTGHVSPGGSMTGTIQGKTTILKRYYYIGDKNKGEKTSIIHFENGKVIKYERN